MGRFVKRCVKKKKIGRGNGDVNVEGDNLRLAKVRYSRMLLSDKDNVCFVLGGNLWGVSDGCRRVRDRQCRTGEG